MRFRRSTVLFFLLAITWLLGCPQSGSSPPPPVSSSAASSQPAPGSEAQRTREMEDKARAIDQQARDIQNMQGTEQEKIDAVNKLEQQRQELNRQSEGAPPPPPSDSGQQPPPPL